MTEEPTLLAVDAGTSTVKSVAFRTTGEELTSSSRSTNSPATALAFIENFGALTVVSALEHALIP